MLRPNSPKTICVFAEFPLSAISDGEGGRGAGQAATWLPQLAQSWASCAEFKIHWGVFDKSAKIEESITYQNQTFHRIPSTSVSVSLLLGRWPHSVGASRLIRKIKPSLIHCWGTENLNSSALLAFQGPSILSMQGIVSPYLKTGDLNTWQWKMFRHYERKSLRLATIVTSESQWGLDRIAEIHPSVSSQRIEYGIHPSFYRITWSPDDKQPRFLFVGGLNRLKGIDILIEMLRRHPKRSWKMVFVGDGYLIDALKNLNDPNIETLGMLKTERVQQEMSKAWGLVMPSRADTSPNVVKEARVIGLPVVGSPHGGHAEYIVHRKDGLIVESANADAWFQSINLLAMNYQLCREMGNYRHEYFREYFQPEKTANAFLSLYNSAL
jgi:glycosyltransferase involved in cell wall biosynthesis